MTCLIGSLGRIAFPEMARPRKQPESEQAQMSEDDSDHQSTHDCSQSDSVEVIVSGSRVFMFEYADGDSDSVITAETTDVEDAAEVTLLFHCNTVACSSRRTRSCAI